MAFGNVPVDAGSVPIAETYVPGVGFVALQGSTLTNTDGSSNKSSPVNLNLTQINSLAVNMAGSDGDAASGVIEFLPGLYNGATVDMLRSSAAGDGLTVGVSAAGSYLYNGASEDRARGNQDNVTLINASAVTTTQTGSDQTNFNARGCHVVLDMTTVGTGSVTLEIDAKDPVSGKYYALLTGAAVVTISTNIYRLYPGVTVAANAAVSDILTRTWRVKVTANNANATTYKVAVILVV